MLDLAAALWLLVAALGLAVSVSYAGLPVLGQGAFVAVGGVGVALLGPGGGAGLPLLAAVALPVAAATALGWLVGAAAARLQGAPLALATWALAWLAYGVLVAFPGVSGGAQGLVRPAPAELVSPALGVAVVLTPAVHAAAAGLVCLLTVAALVRAERGPAGLDLAALRSGPDVAVGLGVPVAARRRACLAVTAGLGALGGAGTTVLLGLVAPADVAPVLSLQLLVAVLVGGAARWWGPVVGVGLLTVLPDVADALATAGGLPPERVRGVLVAALLVAVVALRGPAGRLVGRLRSRSGTDGARPPAPPAPGAGAAAADRPAPDRGAVRPVLLRARGVVAGYGDLRVLDGVDLALRAGEVHALIGPNGSGKSTLLRVLSGALEPLAGDVEVGGRPAPAGTPARVRAGVVRTPQRTAVLPGVRAGRQVAVGARGGAPAPGAVLRHLLGTPRSRAEDAVRDRLTRRALVLTGLDGRAAAPPETLTAGEARLLQVARAVATGARVLLLDEPAAGMTADERQRLAGVLRALADDGAAVLLVEHDLRLVGRVADRVTVLADGGVLARGRPDAVRADPGVRAAYLGR